MKLVGSILTLIGVALWLTPLWFAVLHEILFRCGRGYRRRGVVRRMRITEWLFATSHGIFFGTFIYAVGQALYKRH